MALTTLYVIIFRAVVQFFRQAYTLFKKAKLNIFILVYYFKHLGGTAVTVILLFVVLGPSKRIKNLRE